MGEALLVKAGTGLKANPLDNVDVISGACSLLVAVKDSGGNNLANMPVHCKDGSVWYNYNTNEKGMVLFQCNSGAANITAWNYSILDSYNVIDQTPATVNVDAPVATKKLVEMSLGNVTGILTFTASKANLRFLDTPEIKFLQMVGGGSGGGGNLISEDPVWDGTFYRYNSYGWCGGGGGAYNESLNILIDRSTKYSILVGAGGAGTNNSIYGNAGGTTSAFGYSAMGGKNNIGGGSGNYQGGNGAYAVGYRQMYPAAFPQGNGENAKYANSSFPYGGGGGAANYPGGANGYGTWWYNGSCGGLGGGNAARYGVYWDGYDEFISYTTSAQSGINYGGGGGSGGNVSVSGSGKSGIVFITI